MELGTDENLVTSSCIICIPTEVDKILGPELSSFSASFLHPSQIQHLYPRAFIDDIADSTTNTCLVINFYN